LIIDASGNAFFEGAPGETNALSLFLNPATDRYEFTDANNAVLFGGPGSGPADADCQLAGLHTITAKNSFIVSITLTTNTQSDTVAVRSTADPVTVTSDDGNDTVTLGDAGSVQKLNAPVNVTTTVGLTSLTIFDQADTTGRTMTISSTTLSG